MANNGKLHSNPEDCIKHLIENLLGVEGSQREGLEETPKRYINAMQYLTSGYTDNPKEFLKSFEDGQGAPDSLVFQGGVQLYSLCEHHLLPFFGVAHIGYIPRNKIIGLSKISRVADMFSRRFQVQERLTTQIASYLEDYLDAKAVGVVLRCRHMCMEMRGVRKPGTITYTSSLHGDFKDEPEARAEFMQFVALADRDARV